MITGIKDLDRKILSDYVNKEDYYSLLTVNKYISSLFDDIFFRNRLEQEYNFNCKSQSKKYYNLIYFFNKICRLLKEKRRIIIKCKNIRNKTILSLGVIDFAYSEIFISENRDELWLYVGKPYHPVLFYTDTRNIPGIKEIKGTEKYQVNKVVQKLNEKFILFV